MSSPWKDVAFTSCTGHACSAYFQAGTRGTVIFLHGWGDHAGRYLAIGEQLCQAGFAVLIPDFYGHGRSQGPRARIDSFDHLLNDLGTLLDSEQVAGPTVLVGYSMGGCLAFHAGITYADTLAGVIFNSAALTINPAIPKFKRLLAQLLGGITPHLAIAQLKQPWMMTSVAQEIQDYEGDSLLYHGKIEAGTGLQLMRSNGWVAQNMGRFDLPFLALQGTDDVLVNPQGPQLLMQQSPQANKNLVEFPQARHDLLHDTSRGAAQAEISDWLDRLIG